MKKYDLVSKENSLSSCCASRIIYGGLMEQMSNGLYKKVPLQRVCEHCNTVLSEVVKPQNEMEENLINY